MSSPEKPPDQQMQIRRVALTTPQGVLRGQVAIPLGPMRLAELVPTAYELTNILVGRAVKREEAAGRPVSCKAGCAACCRHMVPVSVPEAFYIADLIDSLEPSRRDDLMARFDANVAVLESGQLIDELLDPEYTDEPILAIARQYFSLGMACPFLVDESCSIHPHRPVGCRVFNVTSPAALCADPYNNKIANVPVALPFSVPLARLTTKLTGTKACLIPLTLVPRWISEHADLRGREWPGPELFEGLMAELEPGDRDRKTVPEI